MLDSQSSSQQFDPYFLFRRFTDLSDSYLLGGTGKCSKFCLRSLAKEWKQGGGSGNAGFGEFAVTWGPIGLLVG